MNEVLACILHTIAFIRSPGPVRPREVNHSRSPLTDHMFMLEQHECELFGITYGKCGLRSVDMMVENAISAFRNDLVPCGPELFKGTLRVIFYENRKRKSFFGGMFGNGEEEFPWEQWTIPVLINESSRAVGNDAAAGSYDLPFMCSLDNASLFVLSSRTRPPPADG